MKIEETQSGQRQSDSDRFWINLWLQMKGNCSDAVWSSFHLILDWILVEHKTKWMWGIPEIIVLRQPKPNSNWCWINSNPKWRGTDLSQPTIRFNRFEIKTAQRQPRSVLIRRGMRASKNTNVLFGVASSADLAQLAQPEFWETHKN